MLAAQLLRILQTIPSDVKCETCVSESDAQDVIMKENQNGTHYDSKNFGRDTNPSLLEVKGMEEYWKPKFDDDLAMDGQNRNGDCKAQEFQDRPFCRLDSLEDDVDSVSSGTNAKDEVQTRPGHDRAVAGGEFMRCNENESNDYRLPYVAASDLLGREKKLYTDKNVLQYERPELIVCYKEINYHVVKDICVDEGMPANRKFLIDDREDDQSGNSMADDDTELPSAKSLDKGAATGCNEEESIQKDGTNVGATSKTATLESFVDKTLPIQEFGTRSFLRSFLNSVDGEGNEVQQLPDQFSSGKVVSLTEAIPKEDVQTSILNYDSKVERRSITFNFNSLAPVVGGVTNGETELIKEQSVDSREVIDQNDAEADIPSARGQAQSASRNNMSNDSSNDAPVVSLQRYDRGESSFAADEFITHSGPIPFSGSLSLRSDGSAISGRSFAFPVLQSEWNSSPVRMTDAERRRFRRHKGWRSGLLCCRF